MTFTCPHPGLGTAGEALVFIFCILWYGQQGQLMGVSSFLRLCGFQESNSDLAASSFACHVFLPGQDLGRVQAGEVSLGLVLGATPGVHAG